MAVGAVVAIIVVALLVSAIMSYIAYRKREQIGEQMRRVSEYARKTSERVRASIKGGSAKDGPPDDGQRAAPRSKAEEALRADQEKFEKEQ